MSDTDEVWSCHWKHDENVVLWGISPHSLFQSLIKEPDLRLCWSLRSCSFLTEWYQWDCCAQNHHLERFLNSSISLIWRAQKLLSWFIQLFIWMVHFSHAQGKHAYIQILSLSICIHCNSKKHMLRHQKLWLQWLPLCSWRYTEGSH